MLITHHCDNRHYWVTLSTIIIIYNFCTSYTPLNMRLLKVLFHLHLQQFNNDCTAYNDHKPTMWSIHGRTYIYMLKTCAQDMLKSAVLVIHKGNRWTHSLKMFIFTLETNHHVCLGHLGLLRFWWSFVANRCQPYDFTRINFTHCSGQRQSDNHRSSLKVVVNNQQWLQLWLQSSNMTS